MNSAEAETAGYFSGPSSLGTAIADSSNSQLYNISRAVLQPNAPSVLFSADIGADEIFTDNPEQNSDSGEFDFSSLFSAGGTIALNTVRFSGLLNATATYRAYAKESQLDQWDGYGFGHIRGIVLPSTAYIDFFGSADDVVRAGGGIENNLIQPDQNTHYYSLGASPVLVLPFSRSVTSFTQYHVSQTWFNNNTQAIDIPGLSLGPLSNETDQSLREDLRLPGAIAPRLLSDISLNARDTDTGNIFSGDLKRASAEWINEYEITRALSGIFGGGYEDVSDSSVQTANNKGAIWDIGARMKPNADSYVLLVYGHHDGFTDFAGELAWRITPRTDVYVEYSDSLTTAQQNIASGNAGALLAPDGAVTAITYNQNPLIGVLDDSLLNGGPGSDAILPALGIPIGAENNLTPLQDGLFRARQVSGSARWLADADQLVLTGYYVDNQSLTPLETPSSTISGGTFSWSHNLAPRLTGQAQVAYGQISGTEDANLYQFAAVANYLASDTISLSLRYDLIWHKAIGDGQGYVQNAVTLSIHKSFD
ncbi:MAG TPA: hypothetical protein VHU18_11855 [Rhizomicrobium sp.]|nr:hypothetical protein [Rhizomicrobium sp.]